MSTVAIQRVIAELEGLPESEAQRVLDFLQAMRRQRSAPPAVPPRSHNSAIREVDGVLVFTGEIGDPNTDWLRIVRDERDIEILRRATEQIHES